MAASADPINVFVYGTLKPGEVNYSRYCAGRIISQRPAIARGHLYALPVGYPAMVAPGQLQGIPVSMVWGYQLQFSHPNCLDLLDELEDYSPHRASADNEYYRCTIPILTPEGQSLGTAWAYLMEPQRAQRMGGRLIFQGEWTTRAVLDGEL